MAAGPFFKVKGRERVVTNVGPYLEIQSNNNGPTRTMIA